MWPVPITKRASHEAEAIPGRLRVIDDANWFKPVTNIYASRKLPSTVLNEDAKVFDNMPG